MKSNSTKKILVIRFSSVGDVLLTTPLLKKIKLNYPGSQIHFLTKKSYSDILKNNPLITKLIISEDNLDFAGLKDLKKEIRNENYDLILDAHNNLRTFYLRLFNRSEKRVFKKYSVRKFLLVKFKINLMKNLPSISERYCRMIAGDNPEFLPEVFTEENAVLKIDTLLNEINPDKKKIICISPSSYHYTKTYPAEYYAEVINNMGSTFLFILTGKGKDIDNIKIILSNTKENVINLCDKLTLPELAEVIKRSDIFISGDTGPMHIAEALGKKLIMMAGSSVREFGFYPQNKNSILMERDGLRCRPCSHIGRSECPLVHFKCMKEIKAEELYSSALKLLNSN